MLHPPQPGDGRLCARRPGGRRTRADSSHRGGRRGCGDAVGVLGGHDPRSPFVRLMLILCVITGRRPGDYLPPMSPPRAPGPGARCQRRWPLRPAARSERAERSAHAQAAARARRPPAGLPVRCGPGRWHETHNPAGNAGHGPPENDQELFFDGVLVEPGDGGQPAGDGRAGASPGFQIPGEPFDVGAADGEQGHGAGAAPGGELAQVQRLRFAGQPAVPGQETGGGEPFWVSEGGWMVARAVDGAVVVIGHLPAGLRPGRLGQRRVPAIERKPNVSLCSRSLHVTDRRNLELGQPPEKRSRPPTRRWRTVRGKCHGRRPYQPFQCAARRKARKGVTGPAGRQLLARWRRRSNGPLPYQR